MVIWVNLVGIIKKCNIFTILFGKYPETLYICTPI